MRCPSPLFLAGVFACVGLASAFAQDESPAKKNPPAEAAPNDASLGFSSKFRFALQKAVDSFRDRDFRATLERVDEMDAAKPGTAIALNIRGAVALEERRFDEGKKYLQEALDKEPKYFPARFNMGEIPFMQKRYAEARAIFEELLAEDPKNELLQYRIFLSYLLEGNDAAAQDSLKKIRYPGDTGAYYYANAAWEFKHSNSDEANRWLKSGDWVFSAEKNLVYIDVLYDLGWVKRPESPSKSSSVRAE